MTDTKYTCQTVTRVHTWVPGKLFSLHITRPQGFDFKAGQFARIGLSLSGTPQDTPTLWRAYSMVSGPLAPTLEFYSIVVPTGHFSPRLAALKPGDPLYLEKIAYGFFTIDRFAVKDAKAHLPQVANEGDLSPHLSSPTSDGNKLSDLWLIASGTGLSAYLSMLRDPATWHRFRRIILVHGVRHSSELAYQQGIKDGSLWPELAHYSQDPRKFIYLGIPSRETLPGMPCARLTTLLADGQLEKLVGVTLHPTHSKIMLCGNPHMLEQARQHLATCHFAPGRRGIPGNLAAENYWS